MEHRCDRKQLFKREDRARQELRVMKRRVIDCFRLQVYFCERHNGWHIGNRPLPKLFDQYERMKKQSQRSA